MAEPKAEAINIVVKDQTGGEVHFKIKKSTKFAKVCSSRLGFLQTGWADGLA